VLYKHLTNDKPSSPTVEVAVAPPRAGPLPDPGLTGPSTTPDASVDEPSSATGAETPAPVAQPEPVAAPAPPPAPNPTPTPAQTPTPISTPPAQCALPSSIAVTGGDHSSLGPSGGSFTVTSTPVVLSADPAECGAPYKMSFSASGPSGTTFGSDCEPHSFSYNISGGANPVKVGDAVAVDLQPPPNSCPQN
jgi:hypothetical protein